MKNFIDPFLYNVPHLDIHGYDRTGAVAVIKIFIDNNLRIDEKKLVIIHGKGEGILKSATHEYLKKDKKKALIINKMIKEFYHLKQIILMMEKQ